MDNTRIDAQWFAKFMTHAANNILDREGQVRFTYEQLRNTLTTIEHGGENIDPAVRELLGKIIGILPPIELSDRQIVTLCLALLNCHMAYHLVNPDLVTFVRAFGGNK